jgi:hypothetical protein
VHWRFHLESCTDTTFCTLTLTLIFDLSRDLAESTPIVVSQSVYDTIDQALQAKLKDIASTPHTKVDYRIGGLDARACCDAGHIVCRCTVKRN